MKNGLNSVISWVILAAVSSQVSFFWMPLSDFFSVSVDGVCFANFYFFFRKDFKPKIASHIFVTADGKTQ